MQCPCAAVSLNCGRGAEHGDATLDNGVRERQGGGVDDSENLTPVRVKMNAKVTMNWDLAGFFPGLDSDAYRAYVSRVDRDLRELVADVAGSISGATLPTMAEFVDRWEEVVSRLRHAGTYVGCLTADDVRNEAAQSERAALAALGGPAEKVHIALSQRLAELSEDELVALGELLPGALPALRRMRVEGSHRMDTAREELAVDLSRDGFHAWGRLYQKVSGGIRFRMERPDGTVEVVPISRRRSLMMEDPDPRVRRAAFDGGSKAWEEVAPVAAAALNGLAGSRLTLLKARGYDHVLDVACHDSRIDRRTLDAMMKAVDGAAEIPKRFLALKAKRCGVDRLGFYEFVAPLPGADDPRLTWTQAQERVCAAFDGVLPELGAYAREAFARRWIEAEPRDGKSPGGFCTSSMVLGESRIFMTFDGSAGDVQTLAHELGHAYHSHVMRDLRPLARLYPMTLAESASTFAEQAYTQYVLDHPSTSVGEQLAILNTRLGRVVAFLLDIPVRYAFERAFYEERERGEVSVTRLCEMMCASQRAVFGDAIGEDGLDPWFWASKLHYYITQVSFYNFPYTFGFLFSMHLWEAFARGGEAGRARYVALLRDTGLDRAEACASRHLGVDLGDPAFWASCMGTFRADLDRFEELVTAQS